MSDAPPHARPALIALVVLGGAAGTTVRAALQAAFPATGGVSIATIAINVSGAFALGWLLEGLGRRGPDSGRSRLARLGIGTGVLGGYTTYSTLAVDTSTLAAAWTRAARGTRRSRHRSRRPRRRGCGHRTRGAHGAHRDVSLLLVALAGGVGAALRFVLDGVVRTHVRTPYPLATMLINVSGSLVLGVVVGATAQAALTRSWHDVLGTGLLGGYTTFSTASVESVRLARGGRPVAAVLHGAGMLVASLVAALLGLALGGLL